MEKLCINARQESKHKEELDTMKLQFNMIMKAIEELKRPSIDCSSKIDQENRRSDCSRHMSQVGILQ